MKIHKRTTTANRILSHLKSASKFYFSANGSVIDLIVDFSLSSFCSAFISLSLCPSFFCPVIFCFKAPNFSLTEFKVEVVDLTDTLLDSVFFNVIVAQLVCLEIPWNGGHGAIYSMVFKPFRRVTILVVNTSIVEDESFLVRIYKHGLTDQL